MKSNININQENSILKITSIADLKSYKEGKIVTLPEFGIGESFVVKITRPSLMSLAKNGKIPNTLLNAAHKLFVNGISVGEQSKNLLGEIYDVIEIIAEAALVEPTYKQLKDNGIELTDNQLTAIFNYTQIGINALLPFHK